MKVEQGQAAFITGGTSGIGRALALALASRGVQVTIIGLQTAKGEESVRLVEEEHARVSYKPTDSPSAIFIRCDVTKTEELAAAYARHLKVFGRLHICINSAGTFKVNPFYEDAAWSDILALNLTALIDSTSKAIQAMKDHGGLILNIGSVYGIVPSPIAPVYAASKAGVAMFTRSLAQLGMGIRVNALCPEYVDTPLLGAVPPPLLAILRDNVGLVPMDRVLEGAFALLDDESKAGECLWVPANKPQQTWPDEETKSKYQIFMKDGSVFTGVEFL
jgi:NAD(P)-dependent dehydrogenase (short-subunit alcohol dehydrogenase family)